MKILRFGWKNFASYGEKWHEVDLSSSEGELCILDGQVGSGKSTISEVVIFGLYGKVDKKSLKDLPNRINHALLVEIEVQCGNDIIFIRRGVKPKRFEVFINDVQQEQAGDDNIQKYLEKEFFNIPYQVFKNLIVLSVDSFKSFLSMSPKDKREIVDKLFGFGIINNMAEVVKTDRKEVQKEIERLENSFQSEQESITSIDQKIQNLKEQEDQEKEEKKDAIQKEIDELKEERKELDEQKKEKEDELEKISSKLQKVRDRKRDNENEYKDIQKKIKLYQNNKCPYCETDLTSNEHTDFYEGIKEKKSKLDKQIEKDKKKEKEHRKEYNDANSELDDIKSSIQAKKSEVKHKRQELESLEEENSETQSSLETLKQEHEEKKSNIVEELSEEREEMKKLDNVDRVIDVKKKVVERILPPLNKSVSTISSRMNFPFFMRFDEDFSCKVSSMGNDINPETLSTGQKKIANYVIVISFVDVLQTLYPELNLIFLDELLSQVDSELRHQMVDILREVVHGHNIKAWLVQHEELPVELFDKHASVYSNGGFSEFQLEDVE